MQAHCIDKLTELESWYARNNGQYLLRETRKAMQDSLDTAFGYHILQLGVGGEHPLCTGSPINHRIYCAEHALQGVDLVAHPDELPLDSDSVDTVIAHHCLEFSISPHQVLREIHRVLTPQGRLLVVGFNPYSFLGMGTRLRGALRHPLWSAHRPVSEHRLRDWLHLLGFEVFDTSRLYSLPPVGGSRVRRWMGHCDEWATRHKLPVGGLYVLHATKQVAGLHRPHRNLLRRRRLIGLVPKPVTSPTPNSPFPQRFSSFEKGDVAA